MQAEFKKEILKQLNKTMNELDKLLKIEGTVSDIQELPSLFVGTTQSTLDYFVRCKEQIEDDHIRLRRIRAVPFYHQGPRLMEDE